jgi:hydrogenase-1 operon protein HyaE
MSDVLDTPPLRRLTGEYGLPVLSATADAAPGLVLLFLPNHARAHLETPDIAAVLPDLMTLCRKLTDAAPVSGAIADAALESRLADGLSLPALVILRDGATVADIPRMRDWDDYTARFRALLTPPEDLRA